MSDLAAFLLARIVERETEARTRDMNAPIHFPGCYYYDNTLDVGRHCDCDDDGTETARVLAECEAKRRIVEAYRSAVAICELHADRQEGDRYRWAVMEMTVLVPVMTCLALPYVDHPDYREEWRPR